MKKIFLLLITIIILSSCMSLVSENKKTEWALNNGFIKAENCPKQTIPERQPQPHPNVPKIVTVDSNGNTIELTKSYLMEIIVMLFGTIEKYQVLVEIYEREYLNSGGKIMPDLTLEELKKLYKSKLNEIDKINPPKNEQNNTNDNYPMTGSSDILNIQVKDFIQAVNEFNLFETESK